MMLSLFVVTLIIALDGHRQGSERWGKGDKLVSLFDEFAISEPKGHPVMPYEDIAIVDFETEDEAFDMVAIAVMLELGRMEIILYRSVLHDLFAG